MSLVENLAAEPLSRISKLFVDRDQMGLAEARDHRAQHLVVLKCGSDVARNAVLQLAVLTAAKLAARCFPSGVRVVASSDVLGAKVLVWLGEPHDLGAELSDSIGAANVLGSVPSQCSASTLLFGDCDGDSGAIRVTFDGWIARTGPSAHTPRLAEREYCPLAGTLAAALAVSEGFLAFAEVSVQACHRKIEVSLWRPDLDAAHPDALGPVVEYLPKDFWVFGLGHLGNALLWVVASLRYANPRDATAYLCDFDLIDPENHETSLLFVKGAEGLKTRRCGEWLEARGFATRLVERRLGDNFRREPLEPGLAFCGFDSNAARRLLENAGFAAVIEAGLGDNADNFDTLSLHTLPNPRPVSELWPDLDFHTLSAQVRSLEQMARANPAYANLAKDDCGRFLLAGKAVAVPFVGTVAACFQVAEALRMLCGGQAYYQLKFRLGSASVVLPKVRRTYTAKALSGVTFCRALPG